MVSASRAGAGPGGVGTVTCGFCGKAFQEDRSQAACRACPLGSNCGLVRCPHCGFENPGTPRLVSFLRKVLRRGGAEAARFTPGGTP